MSDDEPTLPLVYGVWLTGQGWLRDKNKREFADMRLQYAQDALKMCKCQASIKMIDESMIALEPYFLEQEKQSRLINKIKRLLHVLRSSHKQ